MMRTAVLLSAATVASTTASPAPASFPEPRWWEQGGHSVRGVWPKCGLGEGLSSLGQMRGLPAFMAMLDRLHASNVTTLQMVVYDSGEGYVPEDLWCGLAGNNYSKPLANIGTEVDWHTFIDAAHARNMTVTSFWNVAYFWTGSPYFKQAEADILAHGLDALPDASPARWFRWSTRKSKHVKPADHEPNTNWCSDWVWDPVVNASYYGVWGCQPTTDFASPQWRAEMARILTRWIVDLKLDGFMFDAPDVELGATAVDHGKYNPALIRESISGVIRNVSNGCAAAFAEIYSDPPLADAFGFDGEFADDKICPQHSGKYVLRGNTYVIKVHQFTTAVWPIKRRHVLQRTHYPFVYFMTVGFGECCRYCKPNPRSSAIGQGILSANATMIETATAGPGSVDDLAAHIFREQGVAFRTSYLKDLPVSVSWLPGSNISSDFGCGNHGSCI